MTKPHHFVGHPARKNKESERWASSWRASDELTDGASEYAGLVFGDECVAVGDLDQLPMWEDLGQPPPVLRGHNAVFHRPHHERRTAEGAQKLSRGEHVTFLASTHVLGEIAPDLSLSQHWTQPGVGHSVGNWSLRHPPKSKRQAAQRPQAHRLGEGVQTSRKPGCEHYGASGQTGREVLEGFAGGDHQPRYALRMFAGGELEET